MPYSPSLFEEEMHKTHSGFHPFILPFQQLPWTVILNSSSLTSFFTPSSLTSPLKFHASRYSEAHLLPESRCSYSTLNFHLFVMLLITSSFPLLFVFWFGIQQIFLFFSTFNKGSKHSIFCLCPFDFHTFYTTLKLQPTLFFFENHFISCVLESNSLHTK